MLLAYDVVGREESYAAAAHGRRSSEMRFKMAFMYIASNLIAMAAAKLESKAGMRLKCLSEIRIGNFFKAQESEAQ